MHQFHDATGLLPPGHRPALNRDFMPLSGWTLSVLPYVEQLALYEQARSAYRLIPIPWINPPHSATNTVVPIFNCPSDDRAVLPQIAQRSKRLAACCSRPRISLVAHGSAIDLVDH